METAAKFCIECAKEIKAKNPLMINFDNAEGKCIPLDGPSDPVRKAGGHDYGLQYIGSDCAKKFPKSYLVRES